MPTEYTLQDLAKLADVTPRTVRYYIEQGLLPAPTQRGSQARYTESHLARLRLIKKLQASMLPLAEIRARMRYLPEDQIAAAAETPADYQQPPDSALDYIKRILRPGPPPMPSATPQITVNPAPPSARYSASPAAPAPAAAPPAAPAEAPERAQWERISLHPDIELHIRRPLTRLQNKRVERLVSIARQLLEEE